MSCNANNTMSHQSHHDVKTLSDEIIEDIVDYSINEEKEWIEYHLKKRTHVLFVFHIPEELNSVHLFQLFSSFGALKAVVMTHEISGRSRGFGFVHFPTRYMAQIAINRMDGFGIGYKRLRVTFKKEKTNNNNDGNGRNGNIKYDTINNENKNTNNKIN